MSNHKNPSGPWPRLAALAVMIGIILLASGCGGSSSSSPDGSSSPGSSIVAKEVAYSNCMREHGVSTSVNPNGGLSSSGGNGGSGAGEQTVQAAQTACRHLLPNGGQPSQAQQQNQLKQALKYTQCMRSHGVPNFPDPTQGLNGLPGFTIPNGSGINPQSATYQKANQACQPLMSGGGA